MRNSIAVKVLLAVCVGLGVFWVGSPSAQAKERVQEFIERLKERGYHDVALEYSELMKDSPLASDEFKLNILYEQGSLLVDAARHTNDIKAREKLFNDAREKLVQFAKENQGELLGAKASTQLGSVLVERARAAAKAATIPSQASKKNENLEAARKFFDEAKKVFDDSIGFFKDSLADKNRFPVSIDEQKDPNKFKMRQEFRGALIEAQLHAATAVYEKGKTYSPNEVEFKQLISEAAKLYGTLYEDFRTWGAGLYARLYQGRCHQDMKDYKTAVSLYEDLVMQPENIAEFRPLITKGYVQLAECLIAQDKFKELIDRCGAWVEKARRGEERQPDWITLKYLVAVGMKKQTVTLTDKKDDAEKKRLIKEARILAGAVARVSGDYQKSAQQLLGELGREAKEGEPTTYDEAYQVAKDSLDAMTSKKQQKVAADKVAEHNKEVVADRDRAMQYFRMALGLANEDITIDQINLVRYYLCYLNYESQRWYDAAVIGDFMARRYPDAAGARPSAKIALASYQMAYVAPGNEQKEVDSEHVVSIAEYITKRWPGDAEADEAYNMLVIFKLQQKEFDAAADYLSKISPNFASRGRSELRLGQALWSEYIRNERLEKAERPPAAKLKEMKGLAQTTLEAGVQRMRDAKEVNETIAAAELSLTQIYIDTQQYDKAVATLEDEQFGPLTLVKAKSPAVQTRGYAEETYKTALRAYVTSRPPLLDKAQGIMDDLEALVGGKDDAKAAEKLTFIFIALGQQLEAQLELVSAPEEKAIVAKSFETFLERVSKRKEGNNWASRNWIASTFYTLGVGFDPGPGKKISPEAKAYYTKAIDAYKQIVSESKKDSGFAPTADALLGVEMRLADCERKLGNYDAAIERLAGVLLKKPQMLEAQLQAAYVYHERGMNEKASFFNEAILGSHKDEKNQNRIWGWGKISQVTSRYPQHKAVFHEARYNLALSRFEFAKKQTSPADRKTFYGKAKGDISTVRGLFPDLGGDQWRDKYDRLLKDIQKALDEPAIGLKAFDAAANPQALTTPK